MINRCTKQKRNDKEIILNNSMKGSQERKGKNIFLEVTRRRKRVFSAFNG